MSSSRRCVALRQLWDATGRVIRAKQISLND